MRSIHLLLNVLLLISLEKGYAQTNIKQELKNANPVKSTDTISINEKIRIHQSYLKDAKSAKNKKQEFYGSVFLWSDFYKDHNYPEAIRSLLNAERIAQETGNISWQSACHIRNGIISSEVKKYDEAVAHFKKSLECCIQTKDTLCIGESLEEIGMTYKGAEKNDSALYFFKQAIPFLEHASSRVQMGVYYNNYGNLLSQIGDYTEAKKYLDSSIIIAMEGSDVYLQMTYKNNLADFYEKKGDFDNAIKIVNECIEVNKQHNWPDQLVYNYGILNYIYEAKGDYRKAYGYLQSYHDINDSLNGAEVQLKIAELRSKVEDEKRNAELKQKELELSNAKRSMQVTILLIIFGLFLLSIIIWRMIARSKKAKQELLQNQNNLKALTQLLIEKNSLLAQQEEILLKLKNGKVEQPVNTTSITPEPDDFEKNLYNQRILTKEDWLSFKIYFEKAYPGYLFRLRNAFPELTEAEERKFLFIKLNLKRQETAAILGISVDSVNKTRARLRKRLALEENVDLDEYVKAF
jgi:tetratricopeptide (TPR) repeat protein